MNLAVGGRTYDNWVKKADVIRNKQHPPFSRNMVNASRFKVPKSFTEKVCESMTPSINRTGCPKLIIGIPHKNIGLQTPPTLLSPHKNIGVTNPSCVNRGYKPLLRSRHCSFAHTCAIIKSTTSSIVLSVVSTTTASGAVRKGLCSRVVSFHLARESLLQPLLTSRLCFVHGDRRVYVLHALSQKHQDRI